MKHSRKLVIYDATLGYLSFLFLIGAQIAKFFGFIDNYVSARSWYTLPWNTLKEQEPYDEVHYWGHGKPGGTYLNGVHLLTASGAQPSLMVNLKSIIKKEGVFWIRSCSSFEGKYGQEFAEVLSNQLRRDVCSFTYSIWLFQSGGHYLRYEETPNWPVKEGTEERWSRPFLPNTITCFRNSIPKDWKQ